MKSFFLVLCLVFLASAIAPADESGLLLGLRLQLETPEQPEAFGPEQQFDYFTVWIYPTDNGYTYARGPNLLVPRGEDFWEVGVKRRNTPNWVEDHMYSYPVSKPLGSQKFESPEATSGHVSRKITYVGTRGLSVLTHGAGYTEGAAHPWNYWQLSTQDLDHLGKPVDIEVAYGLQGAQALESGFKRYISEHPERAKHLESSLRHTGWGVTRDPGHWKVLGFAGHGAEVYRGSYASFPLDLRVHKKLSAHDSLEVSLQKLKERIPGALDAFQGPGGSPIVILTKDHFHVFRSPQDRQPVLTVDLMDSVTPVMAEWATGPFVLKWTKSVLEFIGADI